MLPPTSAGVERVEDNHDCGGISDAMLWISAMKALLLLLSSGDDKEAVVAMLDAKILCC